MIHSRSSGTTGFLIEEEDTRKMVEGLWEVVLARARKGGGGGSGPGGGPGAWAAPQMKGRERAAVRVAPRMQGRKRRAGRERRRVGRETRRMSVGNVNKAQGGGERHWGGEDSLPLHVFSFFLISFYHSSALSSVYV